MDTAWERLSDADLPALRQFIVAREWACVPFSAALAASRYSAIYLSREQAAIHHALMLAEPGQILPVFTSEVTVPPRILAEFPRAYSVMGTETDVRAVEGAIARPPRRAVDYHLMVLDRSARPLMPAPAADIVVRRATDADRGSLYPLQRDYEKEEVLLDPRTHVPRICRAHLRRALRRQLIYVVERAGIIVSKAATNSRGVRGDQIGGVFTVAAERNRGYAAAAMAALLDSILEVKDFACLFVKRDNPPAIALYRRLGFSIRGGYRICYYFST